MATLEQRPTVQVEMTLRLTEPEARALLALTVYGTAQFLRVFYAQLGRAYLEPHEAGLASLFAGVGESVPPILRRADAARAAFVRGLEVAARAA